MVGILVLFGFVLLLLLLVIGAGIVLFDLGRRDEDARWLQTKIADGLRHDPVMSSLGILPAVHVPRSKDVPVSVALSGEVPSEAARGAVLDLVQETARKRGREIQIDDRLAVRRAAGTRAA